MCDIPQSQPLLHDVHSQSAEKRNHKQHFVLHYFIHESIISIGAILKYGLDPGII